MQSTWLRTLPGAANGVMASALPLLLLLVLAGCSPARHYEAALVLQDFAAEQGESRLKQSTPAPLRQSVTYTGSGGTHGGDLYLPGPLAGCTLPASAAVARGKQCPQAAIVVVPGAVPLGKDDPRLVAFASTLARAGFAVLAPDLPGFRALRIRPSDTREIADAFAYLSSRPELAPGGRAGMFAFSYSVGPALLAALEDDIRDRVRYLVGVGGYHDLQRAMRFFTTGWFVHEGRWHRLTPDDSGRMVLAYSSLDYLAEGQAGTAPDRELFDRMVELRSRDPAADLTPLAAQLSIPAQAVYALGVNGDPARFAELFSCLPAAMRADLDQLNLARHDLKPLRARLMLVHGRNDNLIPYPESLALAAAVQQGQVRVFLIHRVLGHVDLSFSSLFSWRFWSEDLPDLWRLWQAIDLLLAQREASP